MRPSGFARSTVAGQGWRRRRQRKVNGTETFGQTARPSAKVPSVGRRILIVEDDEPTRALIELVLREGGYLVEHSRDGVEALAMVKVSTPDAIILDRNLPKLSGTEFAEAYRTLPGDHAPIVAMCAAVDGLGWASSIGAAASIGKPFAIDDLLAAVASAVAMTAAPTRERAAT